MAFRSEFLAEFAAKAGGEDLLQPFARSGGREVKDADFREVVYEPVSGRKRVLDTERVAIGRGAERHEEVVCFISRDVARDLDDTRAGDEWKRADGGAQEAGAIRDKAGGKVFHILRGGEGFVGEPFHAADI